MDDLELINSINWNGLSCFERALCFCAMSFNKNSIYAFLLLKMGYRNYFEDGTKYSIALDEYYHKVFNLLGLDFSRNYCDRNEFVSYITKEILNGNYIICCSDTFNIPGTKDYHSKHHPHFIAIKEIKNNEFIIVDEDWSKEYWYKENGKHEVIYLEKLINKDELIDYCSDFHVCYDPCQENYLSFLNVFRINRERANSCDIFKEYFNSIKMVINCKNEYFDSIVESAKLFYENFFSNLQKLENNRVDTQEIKSSQKDFILKNRYIYPFELEIVACHHFFLDSQFQALNLFDSKSFNDSKVKSNTLNVLKEFDLIKIFVAKDLYDKKPNHKRFILDQCKKCTNLEKDCYIDIAEYINKSILKSI